MDISAFIGPGISALCAFGGAWLAFSNRLTALETKIDMLSTDVAKHNNVIERTYKLEARVDSLEGK